MSISNTKKAEFLLKHNLEFLTGDIVYLKMDAEQKPRLVIEIVLCPDYSVFYRISDGDSAELHYGMEISCDKDESFHILN